MVGFHKVSVNRIVHVVAPNGAAVLCYTSLKFSCRHSHICFATRACEKVNDGFCCTGDYTSDRDTFTGMRVLKLVAFVGTIALCTGAAFVITIGDGCQ